MELSFVLIVLHFGFSECLLYFMFLGDMFYLALTDNILLTLKMYSYDQSLSC